jgi:DNA-binding HxlR family transcriptional regulator
LVAGSLHVTEQTERCRSVSEIFGRIGEKWSMRVVVTLAGGPRRFSELRRAIPSISQRMLTLTLRNLERDGLVSRTVTPTIPPRVDYELTDLGRSLHAPVEALGQWAIQNLARIEAARTAFDASSRDDVPPADALGVTEARAAADLPRRAWPTPRR